MRVVERFLALLASGAGLIGVGTILALMALTVVTVVFRAIGIAFPGTYSLAELLLIPSISFSLAYAAMKDEHTRVVLFTDRIRSTRIRQALLGVMLALGSVFWVMVAWATIREAIRRGAQNELSPIINVPVAPFRWAMATALVLLCVILLFKSVQLLLGRAEEQAAHDNLETKP